MYSINQLSYFFPNYNQTRNNHSVVNGNPSFELLHVNLYPLRHLSCMNMHDWKISPRWERLGFDAVRLTRVKCIHCISIYLRTFLIMHAWNGNSRPRCYKIIPLTSTYSCCIYLAQIQYIKSVLLYYMSVVGDANLHLIRLLYIYKFIIRLVCGHIANLWVKARLKVTCRSVQIYMKINLTIVLKIVIIPIHTNMFRYA